MLGNPEEIVRMSDHHCSYYLPEFGCQMVEKRSVCKWSELWKSEHMKLDQITVFASTQEKDATRTMRRTLT